MLKQQTFILILGYILRQWEYNMVNITKYHRVISLHLLTLIESV